MTKRVRIDRLLVERGLFESRAKAQQAIAAGMVTADGVIVAKPADEVSADAILQAAPAHPWVSRGGVKLAAALDHFGIEPAGRICLDVGASTGGFTQVLLARGARRVYAVDVGRDQLHAESSWHAPTWSRSRRPTSASSSQPGSTEPPDLVTVDVSFIPLKLVLPAALALVRPAGRGGGADQAAIRGRARPRQKGHGARSGGPRAGLRRRGGARRIAGLDRCRRHPLPDRGGRRQSRIPDCSAAATMSDV